MNTRPALGITLIELIIVVALISVSFIMLVVNTRQAGQLESLRTSSSVFADVLQEARISSQNSRDQSAWGVLYVSSTSYELVSGTDKKPVVSRVVNLEKGSTFKDPFHVWFENGTGNTNPLSIIIQNEIGNSYSISINELGVIQTQALDK